MATQGYGLVGPSAGFAGFAGGWCDTCTLHVLVRTVPHEASCWPANAFFFTDHYLGTDTRLGTDTHVQFVSRTADTVTLRYSLYNAGDSPCFPQGGTADVRFHWDGTRLVPLDPIPDNRSPAAPAAASAPAASECAWAVDIMHQDAAYDASAAQAPQYSSAADIYTTASGHWTQIATWISASCAPVWPAQQCADATAWLTIGRATHEADDPLNRVNPVWTSTWINNYSRMLVLVGRLCA